LNYWIPGVKVAAVILAVIGTGLIFSTACPGPQELNCVCPFKTCSRLNDPNGYLRALIGILIFAAGIVLWFVGDSLWLIRKTTK
jgi:hypothetical protein